MYVSKYCYGHNPKTKQARIAASKRRLKTQGYNPDLSLEECMEYIKDYEYLEVTPASLRMRKIG